MREDAEKSLLSVRIYLSACCLTGKAVNLMPQQERILFRYCYLHSRISTSSLFYPLFLLKEIEVEQSDEEGEKESGGIYEDEQRHPSKKRSERITECDEMQQQQRRRRTVKQNINLCVCVRLDTHSHTFQPPLSSQSPYGNAMRR